MSLQIIQVVLECGTILDVLRKTMDSALKGGSVSDVLLKTIHSIFEDGLICSVCY